MKSRITLPPAPGRPNALWPRLSLLGFALVFVALAVRQHLFVDRYAVNMLYWDQWDFYLPLFNEQGPWEIFSRQHGPHRQGLGFLVTRVLAELSGWNSRWDSFGVSFTLIGAALLAVRLAGRLGIAAGLGLAAIPLFFLNLRQFEMLIGASNISHGAAPVFLLLAYCLVWLHSPGPLKVASLVLLDFFLVFTGFGLFVGLLTPPLLLLMAYHAHRDGQKRLLLWACLGLVACLLTWLLFAKGYRFDPAVENFRFPYEKPVEYFYFVGLMFSNFFGLQGQGPLAITLGGGFALAVFAIGFWHGLRVLRRGPEGNGTSTVLFCLCAFALLYAVNTAVGRVFLGLEAASSSRYVTLMIPGALAVLLQLGLIPSPGRARLALLALAGVTASGCLFLRSDDQNAVLWFYNGRTQWKEAYLRTHSEAEADRASNFKIFPAPIPDRLRYLEKHRINLFSPQDR